MRSLRIKRLVLCAVLTTVIVLLTLLLKIPTLVGYVHIGDAVVCLAAVLLPAPYAIAAAALGGAASDLLGGFPLYAAFTAVIKTCMTLAFTSRRGRILAKRNVFAGILAAVITPVGYFTCDAIVYSLMYGDSLFSWKVWSVALTCLPFNTLQGIVSSVLFFVAAAALDGFRFKRRLDNWMVR